MSKTGYCSLCRSPKVEYLNNAIAAGKGYTKALAEMADLGVTFSKNTFLKHKSHITAPLITEAEAARKNPAIKPQSNRGVLEMIRDIGAQKAIDNPDTINLNHTIRAAKILADMEGKQEAAYIILAKAVQPVPLLEGEFREIPELTTEEDF